tara:strand:+ start:1377 stop:1952 length:576 start_codon:yes stop_codon:yes gene_type:complete
MKTLHLDRDGVRGLSISESFLQQNLRSTLAGVIMTNQFIIDGFVFGNSTIKGDDITEEIISMYEKLLRDDISYILLSSTILSMYNIIDIEKLYTHLEIPIIVASNNDSSGIKESIRSHFPETFETKIKLYESLGKREKITLKSGIEIFLRYRGCTLEQCTKLLDKIIVHGSVPEQLRLAQLLAKSVSKKNN